MKHKLKISVSEEKAKNVMVSLKSVSLRERFMKFLFGKKQKVTILVPGDTIQELAITNIKEGESSNAKSNMIEVILLRNIITVTEKELVVFTTSN